jgi:hypothetical protein
VHPVTRKLHVSTCAVQSGIRAMHASTRVVRIGPLPAKDGDICLGNALPGLKNAGLLSMVC